MGEGRVTCELLLKPQSPPPPAKPQPARNSKHGIAARANMYAALLAVVTHLRKAEVTWSRGRFSCEVVDGDRD